jgi:hypothetical protein
MRIATLYVLVAVVVLALGACKPRPRADGAPDAAAEPDRNPYRNVMPDKVKKQVEDTLKKEDEHGDKVLENAK